jgi:hypothetical protein
MNHFLLISEWEGEMKILSLIAAVGGVLAILMAIIYARTSSPDLGITGAGYLRGATSLFLLSLVVMVFDRTYLKKK